MTWDSHALLSRLNTATADQEAPFAVLDLGAFETNRRDIARRAGGCTVRVASKSLRVRWYPNARGDGRLRAHGRRRRER